MRNKKKHKVNKKDKIVKKTVRKKRKILKSSFDVELFYKIVNKVQLNKESSSFLAKEEDTPVIENILKDLELIFVKKNIENGIQYNISPSLKKIKMDHLDTIESFADEILDNGEIYF